MKFRVYRFALTFLALLSVTLGEIAQSSEQNPTWKVPTALQEAHELFVQSVDTAKDSDVGKKLHDALIAVLESKDLHPAVRQNALDLFREATRHCDLHMPVDWEAPEGIEKLTIKKSRKEEVGQISYRIKVSGYAENRDRLQRVRITAHPDSVVGDSAAKGAELYWEREEKYDRWYWELEAPEVFVPPRSGLYTLELWLDDSQKSQFKFIVDKLIPSVSPTISVPQPGHEFRTGNPLIQWSDFKSPELGPCEKRSISMWVLPEQSGGDWKPSWSFYSQSAQMTEVAIGDKTYGEGVTELESGGYWMSLNFREEYKLGAVRFRREARTSVGFSVNRPKLIGKEPKQPKRNRRMKFRYKKTYKYNKTP